jgi:hypothetical protein
VGAAAGRTVVKVIGPELPTEPVRRTLATVEDAPEDSAGYVDGRIVVPTVGGVTLLGAGTLLWAGSHGIVGGYLALFYGGILAILVGLVFAFFVGVFVLGAISLAGVFWIALERTALFLGPGLGWASPFLFVAGLVLLPGPLRRIRAVAADRRRFEGLKGGSVPP